MDIESSDIELIQRISNRDSKALEILYDKYSPILFTLVKRILGDKTKTEEVLADIFVIIWQKSSLFNLNSGNLYTWLINLSRNKALDSLQRDNSLVTEEYNDEYENDFILPNLSMLIPTNDLEKNFSKHQKIYSAVHNLTEAQQYVLSLAYYEGLTESEIAKKLNIPVLTVKSKIRVALNSVRDNLSKEEDQ
ncbi:MAG: sigma-70 family RNA polymerase sigma factor [Ignavibacteriaceae bacterium]